MPRALSSQQTGAAGTCGSHPAPVIAPLTPTHARSDALPLPCSACLPQVPEAIKRKDGMPLGPKYHEGLTESQFLDMFKEMAGKNKVGVVGGEGVVLRTGA